MSKKLIIVLLITIIFFLTQTLSSTASSDCHTNEAPSNLRVIAIPNEYFIAADPVKGTNHSGFIVDFLDALTKQANLTYNLVARTDLSFGKMGANGSWNGSIIGALINDQADVVGCDITINSARESVVDFLLPFTTYSLQLLINIRGHRYIGAAGVQYLVRDDADLVFLKNAQTKELQIIYNSIKAGMPGSIMESNEEGLAKVMSGNYGYISESPYPDQALAQNPKKVIKMQDNLGTFHLALAVQQGSPLRKRLNLAYMQIAETGNLRTILNKNNIQ